MLKINMILGNIPEDFPVKRTIDNIIEYFIFSIVLLPFVGILIYTIINPETVATWGNRWKYEGDLEPTEEYIGYVRATGIIGLLILISGLILSFSQLYGILFLILSVGGSIFYFLLKS